MTTIGLSQRAFDLTRVDARLAAYNLAYLALTWVVVAGAVALFWLHPAWYTFAVAFVVVSSRQQALLNCEHEASHGKFLPDPAMNTAIGRYLCAAPVGSPYGAAKTRHLAHHRLVGTDEDPDHDLHAGPSKETRSGLAKHFVAGLLGAYAGMVLMGPRGPAEAGGTSSARADLISLAIVQTAIVAALTLTTAWWVYPLLWLAPLATVTTLCHLVRSFAEHAITGEEATEHSNRLITIRSNLLERMLLSPYNMNLHAEHHLMPRVPAPRLPQARERLEGAPGRPAVLERGSYASAVRHYAQELRR